MKQPPPSADRLFRRVLPAINAGQAPAINAGQAWFGFCTTPPRRTSCKLKSGISISCFEVVNGLGEDTNVSAKVGGEEHEQLRKPPTNFGRLRFVVFLSFVLKQKKETKKNSRHQWNSLLLRRTGYWCRLFSDFAFVLLRRGGQVVNWAVVFLYHVLNWGSVG